MKITDDQMRDCVSRGMSNAAIAAHLNVHRATVQRKRIELKLPGWETSNRIGRKRRFSDEQVLTALNLGWTDWHMAREFGVSVGAVQKRRSALGFRTSDGVRRGSSLSRDADLRRLAAEGRTAREIGKMLSGRCRPLSPRTIILRCRALGIELADAPSDEGDEFPEMTKGRLEEMEAKMAAAMAGHSYESLEIKSTGIQRFDRPPSMEPGSSAGFAA